MPTNDDHTPSTSEHPANPQPGLPAALTKLTQARAFQFTVLALIVVAAVLVGLETYPGMVAAHGNLLLTLDRIIIALFTIEIIIRIGAHGTRPWRFFRSPWNIFDFVIVALCLLPASGQFAAVVRLARVFRALRLFSAIPRLQVIVGALLHAIPSIVYVAALLLIVFYVYAVIGVFLFRDADPVHFATLHDAMLTLFRVVTLEDWTDLMYTQIYGPQTYPIEGNHAVTPTGSARPLLAAIYFVSFVLLGTMIVLNLFIGVVLSSMNEAQQALARRAVNPSAPDAASQLEALQRQLEDMREQLGKVAHTLRQR